MKQVTILKKEDGGDALDLKSSRDFFFFLDINVNDLERLLDLLEPFLGAQAARTEIAIKINGYQSFGVNDFFLEVL